MRQIIADTSVQQYLENSLESEKFSFGIIIGQPTKQSKDYVVHLARTPHDSLDIEENAEVSSKNSAKDVESISIALLVDHALSAIRMMPGGLYILGIFVVSSNNVFESKDDFRKLKLTVKQLADVLKENKNIFACSDEYDNGEKLILHYAGRRSVTCKTIEIEDLARAGNGRPVDWKFQDKGIQWQQIETIYDTNYIFPLLKTADKPFYLEENINITMDKICRRLEKSFIFFDGEPFDANESFENILKKSQNRKNEPCILKGSIYLPCKEKIDEEESKIIRYEGTLKYSGIVYSKIWIQTKLPIDDVQKFIKADILRSIASRFRLYLDTATCVETQQELDYIWITEPPRRVFFELAQSQIMFSDYIFRGETEDTVVVQAKDILDIEIGAENVISDFEIIPEIGVDDELTINENTSNSSTVKSRNADNTKITYILGIVLALGILFISIGFHFVFNYD